jgi:predicted transcriptional regulator
MKKTILAVFFILWWCVNYIWASELKIGEKAPDFSLKDTQGKIYTLDSAEFMGKVLSILYTPSDKKELNNHFEDILHNYPGLDRSKNYIDIRIANLKDSKFPNFIIKSVIKNKQEKTGGIILLDDRNNIINLWGLKNHPSDFIVLDKNRICRYIYKGKLTPEEINKAVVVIKEYQVK